MTSRIPVPLRARPHSAFARASSTALCVALVGASLATPAPAVAAPVSLLRLAPDEAPASVLGLDGKDSKANIALTNALRKAFANRGLSGGEEISLEEMRLTMGCSNDAVSCLSEGGKTLGVRRLVYGYLRPTGGGNYTLDIQILDVEAARLEGQTSVSLTKADLAADQIDAKAAAIVGELMPPEDPSSDMPPPRDPLPETDPDTEPETEEEEEPPPKDGGLYFGLERPTPKWKWAGFATGLGLTVVGAGATIGLGVWLSSKTGGFRKELLDAAQASLDDSNAANDVDPELPQNTNLCVVAREDNIDPMNPELVRNAAVARVCNKGDLYKTGQIVAGAGTAAFGVMTLVFTALLVVHKRKPAAQALLRHGVRLGVAPSRQGVAIGGTLRF